MDRADQLNYAFTVKYAWLMKNLPADEIFLGECFSKKLISQPEQELILSEATNFRRVNRLLLILHRRSRGDKSVFPRLMELLVEFNKEEGGRVLKHVLTALEQSASEAATSPLTYSSGDLDERERELLLANEEVIISSLDTEQVLPELVSRLVVSVEEGDAVTSSGVTEEERAKTLVDTIKSRGKEAYDKFVAVLQDSSYRQLAMKLTSGGTEVDNKKHSK